MRSRRRKSTPRPTDAEPNRALFALAAGHALEALDVSLCIWRAGQWMDVHRRGEADDVIGFEVEHGVEGERTAYNNRSIREAARTRSTIVGRHQGFTDLFVPVLGDRVDAVLVVGPTALERASAVEILERWRRITKRQGDPSDPELSRYLERTLDVLTLEGGHAATFRKLVECLARMLANQGVPGDLLAEVVSLRTALAETRMADRTWQIARELVDETTRRRWSSWHKRWPLHALGVERVPEQVIVGMIANATSGAEPVDEIVRRDALQRACVELAHRRGNMLSGRIGRQGVTLLCAGRGTPQRTRRVLLDVAEQAAVLGRREHGLTIHWGICSAPLELGDQYQVALSASEAALVTGQRSVEKAEPTPARRLLGLMRRELSKLVETDTATLPVRFDRYLEAVLARAGRRFELVQAHAEAAFERIADSVVEKDALDARTFQEISTALEGAVRDADTVDGMLGAFRRAIRDVADAVAAPVAAKHDRSLVSAKAFVQKHYTERLHLSRVARLAGFAPKYFSRLFHAREGVTFEKYVAALRVERARQLLSGTRLTLQRVAQLSGFSTANYLGRAFKRATGETPLGYRRRYAREMDRAGETVL